MLAEPLLFTGSQLLLNPDHLSTPLEEELPLETQVFSMSRLLSLSFGVFEKKGSLSFWKQLFSSWTNLATLA